MLDTLKDVLADNPLYGALLLIALTAFIAGALQRPRRWRRRWRVAASRRVLTRLLDLHDRGVQPGQLIAYLRKLDPYLFEELILSALERRRLEVHRNRRYSGDGGVDGAFEWKGKSIPIQAKRYRRHIARVHVAEFEGLVRKRRAPFGIFVHTGRTGKGAREATGGTVVMVSGQRLLDLLLGRPVRLSASLWLPEA